MFHGNCRINVNALERHYSSDCSIIQSPRLIVECFQVSHVWIVYFSKLNELRGPLYIYTNKFYFCFSKKSDLRLPRDHHQRLIKKRRFVVRLQTAMNEDECKALTLDLLLLNHEFLTKTEKKWARCVFIKPHQPMRINVFVTFVVHYVQVTSKDKLSLGV